MNWSLYKKVLVTFEICLLTFSIYIGSAIYTAGIEGVVAYYHVSQVKVSGYSYRFVACSSIFMLKFKLAGNAWLDPVCRRVWPGSDVVGTHVRNTTNWSKSCLYWNSGRVCHTSAPCGTGDQFCYVTLLPFPYW